MNYLSEPKLFHTFTLKNLFFILKFQGYATLLYYPRFAEKKILQLASYFPAVAVVGPRQVVKTSLVQAIRNQLDRPSVYLDLESPDDLIRLDNPSLFLNPLADHTVILDEVQKLPSLFPQLRGIIERERHPGRFIKINIRLLRNSAEAST